MDLAVRLPARAVFHRGALSRSHDLRRCQGLALAWPEVEDGTSYGTPALKVRKKILVRLKEDGDSLVMPGVPMDERDMLVESRPKVFYFTDHYRIIRWC